MYKMNKCRCVALEGPGDSCLLRLGRAFESQFWWILLRHAWIKAVSVKVKTLFDMTTIVSPDIFSPDIFSISLLGIDHHPPTWHRGQLGEEGVTSHHSDKSSLAKLRTLGQIKIPMLKKTESTRVAFHFSRRYHDFNWDAWPTSF